MKIKGQEISKKVITHYIMIMLLFSLDFLYLTPRLLSVEGSFEANPIHALGINLLGTNYFYFAFIPFALAFTYVFYKIQTYPHGRKYAITFLFFLVLITLLYQSILYNIFY